MIGLIWQLIASVRLARKFPRNFRLWIVLLSLAIFAARALTKSQEKHRINAV